MNRKVYVGTSALVYGGLLLGENYYWRVMGVDEDRVQCVGCEYDETIIWSFEPCCKCVRGKMSHGVCEDKYNPIKSCTTCEDEKLDKWKQPCVTCKKSCDLPEWRSVDDVKEGVVLMDKVKCCGTCKHENCHESTIQYCKERDYHYWEIDEEKLTGINTDAPIVTNK